MRGREVQPGALAHEPDSLDVLVLLEQLVNLRGSGSGSATGISGCCGPRDLRNHGMARA